MSQIHDGDLDRVHFPMPAPHPDGATVLSPKEWRDAVQREYLAPCATGEEFSADDLRARVTAAPSDSGAAWGAVFQWGSHRRYATFVRMGKTRRKIANQRPLRIWRGTDEGAAACVNDDMAAGLAETFAS